MSTVVAAAYVFHIVQNHPFVDGKAEERPIHGSSTPEECADLDEEGVPYSILPKPELDS